MTGFDIGVAYACSSTFSKPDCQQGPDVFSFGDTGLSSGFQLGATVPARTYSIFSAPSVLKVLGFSADNQPLTASPPARSSSAPSRPCLNPPAQPSSASDWRR